MYSVVLMMALSGGADAVEFGRHRGGCNGCDGGVACYGGAPVGCNGGAPVVVGCDGGAGCNGCHGGGHGLFRRRHGCDGGCGGLFGGGLFRRKHGNGCCGCDGGAPVGCYGGVPAGCVGGAPAPVPCPGCTSSVGGVSVPVASINVPAAVPFSTTARVGAPVVINSQPAFVVVRR